MQLVEQGRLELDRPAADWVPELGETHVLDGFDDSGQPVLRRPRRPITLRHLLTHTAGFAYEIWSPEIIRYQEAKGVPGIITCQNAALQTPLLFDPGDRWEYGINIDWVGKMVEAVSEKRLGAYLQEHVFEPLGMTDTAFELRPDMRARLAKIHQRGEDDALAPLDFEIPQRPEFEMGGGGLYGTVGDYLKFVRMVLNRGAANGRQVLQPATVDAMARNQMGDCRVRPVKTAMPPLSNDAEFFPGTPKSWGLTFMINMEEAPTGRSAGSLAWAARQLLLVDRSEPGRRRCLPDPGAAVRRQEIAAAVLRVRADGVPQPVLRRRFGHALPGGPIAHRRVPAGSLASGRTRDPRRVVAGRGPASWPAQSRPLR